MCWLQIRTLLLSRLPKEGMARSQKRMYGYQGKFQKQSRKLPKKWWIFFTVYFSELPPELPTMKFAWSRKFCGRRRKWATSVTSLKNYAESRNFAITWRIWNSKMFIKLKKIQRYVSNKEEELYWLKPLLGNWWLFRIWKFARWWRVYRPLVRYSGV